MTIILAVDQSTSATKAMLFTGDASLLDHASVSHRQIFPRAGWVEHDADEIYQNMILALRNLRDKDPDTFKKAAWLSITNQRETIVIFDRKSGEPLYNAIVWQDRRGEAFCAQIRNSEHAETLRRKTGLFADTYFPAGKLTWVTKNCPEITGKIKNGSALIGTIDTYLIYRLTKGKVYATDHTNASRTLFYDIGLRDWDRDLLEMFGLPPIELPVVQESASVFGETDLEGILPKPIPIAGVMGDSQAALFAERCFDPGMAKITFGTGSSILMNIGHEKKFSENGIVTALAWVLQGEPTYAFEGITNFTGAVVAWLKDQLNLIPSAEASEALAVSVPDNGGVIFVPSFVGFSAPYWRSDVQGAIFGLTPGVTKEHIARAALEGIGFTVTDVLRVMGKDAGIPLLQLNADGGAARNRFLMQFVADLNQRELWASNLVDLSALGAVFSGGLAVGTYRGLDELRQIETGFSKYAPQMPKDKVDEIYAGWLDAVKKILS